MYAFPCYYYHVHVNYLKLIYSSHIFIYTTDISVITHTHPVYEIAAEVLKMRTDCQGHSDAVGVATPPLNMSHPKTSKDYTMARGLGFMD